jgi:hypothetical protein
MMGDGELEGRKNLALKLVWISAISLLVGGSWAWFIVSEGGPEALGAIMPLMAVGGIHLFAGPVAIYQAYRIRRLHNCSYVYVYYVLFLVTTFSLFPQEILTYILIFILVTIAPILFSSAIALFNKHE